MKTLNLFLITTLLATTDSNIITPEPVQLSSPEIVHLSPEQVLRLVARRLQMLEELQPSSQDGFLNLLETRVTAIEHQLDRLETKFDLQMDRLEEVLISRNNLHLKHNRQMHAKLEATSTAVASDIGERLDHIEAQISSTASHATEEVANKLQKMQHIIIRNVTESVVEAVEIQLREVKEEMRNITSDVAAEIYSRLDHHTSDVRDEEHLEGLERRVISRADDIEDQLSSQLREMQERLHENITGMQRHLQTCSNKTEGNFNTTQNQLQKVLQKVQADLSLEMQTIRHMVERNEAEHAVTRQAVYDGHSATQRAAAALCSRSADEDVPPQSTQQATANPQLQTNHTKAANNTAARVASNASQAKNGTPLALANSAAHLERQLEDISQQLEEGLQWLEDGLRRAHEKHDSNLALHAASVRNRFRTIGVDLAATASKIIQVVRAAHVNAPEVAAAQHAHNPIGGYLRQIAGDLSKLADNNERLSSCRPDRQADYEDLSQGIRLEGLAEVTNDGFGKLQRQLGDLAQELQQARAVSRDARRQLNRQVSLAFQKISLKLTRIWQRNRN